MNATWPDLTEKLDPIQRRALRIVAQAAARIGVEWFLTGAMARDLVFTAIRGIATLRATRDADIGIALAGWDEFARLRAEIVGSGDFEADRVSSTG